MNKSDEPLNIQPDPNCCDIWPLICHTFEWMHYADQPEMATMPLIKGSDGKSYFVNYCPACGAKARNRNMRIEDTISDDQVKSTMALVNAQKACNKAKKIMKKAKEKMGKR